MTVSLSDPALSGWKARPENTDGTWHGGSCVEADCGYYIAGFDGGLPHEEELCRVCAQLAAIAPILARAILEFRDQWRHAASEDYWGPEDALASHASLLDKIGVAL